MNGYPQDPTLTPLLKEHGFWAALIIGLPQLLMAYLHIFHGLQTGADLNMTVLMAGLAANPVTLYLLARQYPRGKSAEALGVQLAAVPGPDQPGAPIDITPQDMAEAQDAVHGTAAAPAGPVE